MAKCLYCGKIKEHINEKKWLCSDKCFMDHVTNDDYKPTGVPKQHSLYYLGGMR